MKKLMFKDFVLYGSPCVNCNSITNLNLITQDTDNTNITMTHLTCNVYATFTEIDLKISYKDALSLKIIHKTNIFETNNLPKLLKFFSKKKVHLVSSCSKGGCSRIESSLVELDTSNFRIKPVHIINEGFIIDAPKLKYIIYTDFYSDKSYINVIDYNGVSQVPRLELPAIPLTKIRNKEKFFNKMKTYVLFS